MIPMGTPVDKKHGVFHGTLTNAPVHGVWRKFMLDMKFMVPWRQRVIAVFAPSHDKPPSRGKLYKCLCRYRQ